MADYPYNHGGRENGGTVRFLRAQEVGELPLWTWTPQFEWACELLAGDLLGAAATPSATITIPASGFVSGRLVAAFAVNGVAVTTITADAFVGDDEVALGASLASEIFNEISGTLEGVVASVTDNMDGTVDVVGERGIGRLTITLTWTSAPVYTVQLSGAPIDADYSVAISGTLGVTSYSETVTTTRTGGSPATIADLVAQIEADIEAEAGLDDFVISADDDTVDTNTIQFAPGATVTAVTASINPLYHELLFGGTATDGDYVATFAHSSLPADVPVTVTRSTTPATNADLAAAMATAIGNEIQLSLLVDSAADSSETVEVTAFPGVTGLEITASAPAPGTLTSTPLEFAVADATPAGPAVTVAYSTTVDLNTIAAHGRFPYNALRKGVALEVVTGFGATRTVTLGNADGAAALMGTAAGIDANTAARTLQATTDTQYRTFYEASMAPTATFALGSSSSVTVGRAVVQIVYWPAPLKEAS